MSARLPVCFAILAFGITLSSCGGSSSNNSPGNNDPGSTPQKTAGSFVQVGNLNVARESHAATLLQDGKVLVSGGSDASGIALSSAELFDPKTDSFQLTGSMNTPRMGHSATLLPNGQVLIAGGTDIADGTGNYFQSAELYDPAAGTFTAIPQQTTYPHQNNSVLLNNGQVMLQDLILSTINTLFVAAKADLYDASTNTFTAVPEANSPTGGALHQPCLGALLINNSTDLVVVGSPYAFDSTNLTYTPLANSAFGYYGCSVTLLKDGTVFIAGGWAFTDEIASGQVAQVWDPVTQMDTMNFNMPFPLTNQAAALLQSGNVLLIGGLSASTEIFDLSKGQVLMGPSTIIPRPGSSRTGPLGRPTATLLLDGRVLVIGGVNLNKPPSPIAETYVPPGT